MSVEGLREIEKKGIDLDKLIPTRYRCPLCEEILVGLMSWARHTASVHRMTCIELERKYGPVKRSYYNDEFNSFNPSKR